MKTTLLYLLLSFGNLWVHNHELTIQVVGLEKFEGQIMLAIYNNPDGFLDRDKIYEARIIPISPNDPVKVPIALPTGEYAISIFQDLNMDKEINANFFGIPREPYGFSNNPKIIFGRPDFNASSFKMSTDTAISIRLVH